MKSAIALLIAGPLAVLALTAFPQQTAQKNPPNLPAVRPSSVPLPDGNGVWVILVRRTGGFIGVPVEVTVDSAGKLLCPQCKDDRISRTLSGEALKSATPSFSFGIAPTTLAPQADTRAGAKTPVAPPRVSGCSDCVSTHITIQRRDAQGKVEIYTAEWDNLTAASAPPEFVKLVNAIIALAK